MMRTLQLSDEPLQRYFQEAASLRLNLEYNQEDYAFMQKGGRIVYLMDANVVLFFVNPVREVRHVAAFDESEGTANYAAGTALITAEFLFSRGLAGQDDYPALIAPSHADDLSDVQEAIRGQVNRADQSLPREAEARVTLQDLVERVERRELTHNDAVIELRNRVPELATMLLEGAIQEANQLLRLYREDLLRPLAVHPDVTLEILDVAQSQAKLVTEWESRIRRERGSAPAYAPTRKQQARHGVSHPARAGEHLGLKIRRDAEALVQTMLLDQAAREADPLTRYVLITADRAFFDAYAQWFWNDAPEAERKGARFLLRTPLQYAPILNVNEMPNGIERSDVIRRTREALDALLAPLRTVDQRYPQTLSIHRILAKVAADKEEFRETLKRFYGFNPFELTEDGAASFERIKRDWQDGFRSGIVLNVELMRRRARADFERLSALLRTDIDLRTAIHEDQRRIIEQVQVEHLRAFTLTNIIKRMIHLGSDIDAPPRGPLAVRAAFPRIVGSGSLDAVLDALASGKDRDLITRIEQELKAQLDVQALFFTACVAYRCSLWHEAWQCASCALQFLPPSLDADIERHEIAYLITAATRFALPSPKAIENSIILIEQSTEYYRANYDHFGLARALCTHVALLLVVLYGSHLLRNSMASANAIEIDTYIAGLHKQFDEAKTALADARKKTKDEPSVQALEVIETQVNANVISAEVFARLLASDDTRAAHIAPPEPLIKQALKAMETRLANGRYPPVLEAEYIMARFFRGSRDREDALKALHLAKERGATERHKLTKLDSAEFERFEAILLSVRLAASASGGFPSPEARGAARQSVVRL